MAKTSGSLADPIPKYPSNVGTLILDRLAKTPNRAAFRSPTPSGGWRTWTWKESGEEMKKVGAGLIALGLNVEDRVAIASNTRLDWIIADCGIMLSGGATTTIYPSTADEDFGYILADCGARYLIAEDQKQVDKVLHQRDRLPDLTQIIIIDGPGDGGFVITWDELKKKGADALAADANLIQDRVAQLGLETLATLIYTSGTTGKPKGVELPHRCWVFEGASIDSVKVITSDDVQYLWLPLSHVFGKVLISIQLQIGFESAVDGRVPEIIKNLPVIQPTFMAGVPRIYEKIYNGAMAKGTADGGLKAKIFLWAFDTGASVNQARREGKSGGLLAGVKLNLADKLVFSKIKALTGGRIRYFISGSAALNGDVARWFDAAGMPVLEGYGLSETSAAACIVRPDNIAFGVVGPPVPGTEAMIAEDGEILLRGPHIMRGYRNLPEANAEVMLPDGWFATGDIGEIDAAGRLKITDRKKDLVKTSGGKYIAPGQIESKFKAMSAIASNLVVHANNRNFASALVSLDPEALQAFADSNGLKGDFATLSQTPEVRNKIQEEVDKLNATLNRWETIKKFTILDRDLTEESGELTASLKVKRKVVEEHFQDKLDAMYS